MRRLSLRARLTLWYTIALLVVLSLFGADVLWQQRRLGVRRVDRELEALTTTLENVVRDELTETHDPAAAAKEARTTVTAPARAVAILDADGRALPRGGTASSRAIRCRARMAGRWSRPGAPRPVPGAFTCGRSRSAPRRWCCWWQARCRTSRASSAKRRKPCGSGFRSCCCWRGAAACGWPPLASGRSLTWRDARRRFR